MFPQTLKILRNFQLVKYLSPLETKQATVFEVFHIIQHIVGRGKAIPWPRP